MRVLLLPLVVVFCACPPPPASSNDAGPLQAAIATTVVDVPVGAPTGGYSRDKAQKLAAEAA